MEGTSPRQGNALLFLGMLLFLLGLLIGIVVPFMANPRMGLSSHLEGVMNGMFLMLLGMIWPRIDLSPKWTRITYWLAIYGTFANFLGIALAAIFDAGKMLNIAAGGKEGPALAEGIVTFCLISLTVAMIMVSVLALMGLRRHLRS